MSTTSYAAWIRFHPRRPWVQVGIDHPSREAAEQALRETIHRHRLRNPSQRSVDTRVEEIPQPSHPSEL